MAEGYKRFMAERLACMTRPEATADVERRRGRSKIEHTVAAHRRTAPVRTAAQ